MNNLEYILNIHKTVKFWSTERKAPATNTEIRRWFERGSIEIDGVPAKAADERTFPVKSLVLFPKGNRRITML